MAYPVGSARKRARLILSLQLALPVVGTVGTFVVASLVVILPAFRDNLMRDKREATRDHLAVAWSVVARCYEWEASGRMTREEAQDEACNLLRDMRYGADGRDYFWVNDLDARMVMHPYRPDLEGQNLWDYPDVTGHYLFRDFVRVAHEQGAGWVEYTWQRNDDPTVLAPKISFVRLFEPWGWVLGTGVYVDDVVRQAADMRRETVIVSAVVAAVLLILTLYLRGLALRGERERLQAEGARAASEQRLAEIIQWLPDGVMVADAEHRLVAWNRAMEEITGVAAEQVLGRSCAEVSRYFYHDERPVLLDLVLAGAGDGPPARYDYVAHDGERLSAEAFCPALPSGGKQILGAAGPLRDATGRTVAAIETIRDVTALREAEKERIRLLERLHTAQRMEVMGRLAGGIAHDFNNLLCPILGLAELLLLDASLAGPAREHLTSIAQAAQRAGELTRQLLAFGRRQELAHVTVDLNRVVRGFEPIIRGALRENIELRMDLADGLWMVCGDTGQLEQVLMNLVVNAQDAMPEGGLLAIATANTVLQASEEGEEESIGPGGEYATLTVTDSGAGMDDETRARAFEPFFTTKPSGRGTGLGLASVHGIVLQHGGRLFLHSEVGVGTTIEVSLPRDRTADEASAPPTDDEEALSGTETVLVVEDDEMVRDLARSILSRRGYHVLAASGGPEALALAERYVGPIHALLSDVIMPRMNGPELSAELTRTRPETRVVFMSGYAGDPADRRSALPPGALLVEKPFSSAALLLALRRVLDA